MAQYLMLDSGLGLGVSINEYSAIRHHSPNIRNKHALDKC